jgi:hypothetical protein
MVQFLLFYTLAHDEAVQGRGTRLKGLGSVLGGVAKHEAGRSSPPSADLAVETFSNDV